MILIPIEEENGLKGQRIGVIGWYIVDNCVYFVREEAIIFNLNNILYVHSDTPNTADAIKNAAQKRINDYLQNENVKPKEMTTVKEYLLNEANEDEYVCEVEMEIDENLINTFNIVIKRDSSKMINSFKTIDLMSGIEVNTNNPITLDTVINVTKLTSGTEYDRIIGLLSLTDSVTYDIKLYSRIQNKNITELEDGTFEVKIPIPEKLQGKDLTAYYVNENGEIEEHEVTIQDGYTIFKTTHISIYTLGNTKEKIINEEEDPKTYDNFEKSLVLGTISLIGLIGITLYLKKQ